MRCAPDFPWSAFGTSMVPSRTTWLKDHIVPRSRSIHGQATAGVIRNSTTHASALSGHCTASGVAYAPPVLHEKNIGYRRSK